MDSLLKTQSQLFKAVNAEFIRSHVDLIDWDNRLIGIKGPRGSGKTTAILQFLKFERANQNVLYASADHPFFYNTSFFELADVFTNQGGEVLAIDEVHRYPNWSNELKAIYDSFPELKVVFSSSSALNIFRGEADLSRRASVYELPGMSFREFLNFKHKQNIAKISLYDLIENHVDIATEICTNMKILPAFKQYLQFGYLPFFKSIRQEEYTKRLINILNATLESDLALIEGYSAANTFKVKRLLGAIAEIVPYEPNISDLAKRLKLGRDTVVNYLYNLESAGILNFLFNDKKGMANLQKPNKIYLENTNLSYALKANPDVGTLRETFVLNQLQNSGIEVELPSKGDFLIDKKFYAEVGGRNKAKHQLKGIENPLFLIDDIEIGFGSRIPLYLVGLLY